MSEPDSPVLTEEELEAIRVAVRDAIRGNVAAGRLPGLEATVDRVLRVLEPWLVHNAR